MKIWHLILPFLLLLWGCQYTTVESSVIRGEDSVPVVEIDLDCIISVRGNLSFLPDRYTGTIPDISSTTLPVAENLEISDSTKFPQGTLLFSISNNTDLSTVALAIPLVSRDASVYCNGIALKRITNTKKFDVTSQNESTPLVVVPVQGTHVVVAIENRDQNAQFYGPLLVGKADSFFDLKYLFLIISALICAFFFFFFIYNLILYLVDRSEKKTLFLGLFSFSFALQSVFTNLLPFFTLVKSSAMIDRGQLFTSVLFLPLLILLLDSLTHKEKRRASVSRVILFFALFPFLFFLVPYDQLATVNMAVKVVIFLFFAALSVHLFRVSSKFPGCAFPVFISTYIFFALVLLVDAFEVAGLVPYNVPNRLSQFLFVLSFVYIYARLYIEGLNAKRTLSAELEEKSIQLNRVNARLDELNSDMDKQVTKRTEEYKVALSGVEGTLQELEKVHSELEHDLFMASNVQKLYFSEKIPRVKGWEIAFTYRPMHQVSGDMFDFYVQNGEMLGMSLFDVSGHGVQSALVTMLVKNIISELFYKLYEKPVGTILEIMNKRLIEEIDVIDNYLTGLLVKTGTNAIEVANASHANILHRINKTGEVRELKPKTSKGNFLGIQIMDEPFFTDSYLIEPEDSILLFSDGLYEEKIDNKLELRGLDVLQTVFRSCKQYQSAESQLDYIMKGTGFEDNSRKQADDLTVILLKKL